MTNQPCAICGHDKDEHSQISGMCLFVEGIYSCGCALFCEPDPTFDASINRDYHYTVNRKRHAEKMKREHGEIRT